jgi:flagellar hook-basal body complex protein FliE
MKIGAIDSGRIEAMLTQLRSAANQRPQAPSALELQDTSATKASSSSKLDTVQSSTSVNFSDALKSSLDSIQASQNKADALGKSFALGDDSVNLSDVMIAGQKASLSLQTGIQVRNKLVSAYHDIMNMQV